MLYRQIFIMLSFCLIFLLPQSVWPISSTAAEFRSNLDKSIPKLPLIFERNQGQFSKKYDFIAQTPATFFTFAKNHVNVVLKRDFSASQGKISKHSVDEKNNVLKMGFIQANAAPKIVGLNRMRQKVNYLRGKPSQWIQNVETFSKLEYIDLYPNINLQFHFLGSKMEFDFVVLPGGDPAQIVYELLNAEQVVLGPEGKLVINLNGQRLIQSAPIIYQEIHGERQYIDGSFRKVGNRIAFDIGNYDDKYILIIDPVIEFSGYFGGEWEDQANVIKTDSQGNIFVAGATSAQARITVANKLNSEAVAVLTKVDEATGILFQKEHGISLDADVVINGAILDLNKETKITRVDGVRQSEDYQYSCDYEYRGFFNNDRLVVDYDGFLSKFDENFNPIFTTYFGGCRNDSIRAMVIDKNDNIYLTGLTLSTDFPVKFPTQATLAKSRFKDPIQGDAFYAKFDNSGALIFASFLGGDGQDGGRDITVDDVGNIYLLGYTHSQNLATKPCPDVGARAIACDNIGGLDTSGDEEGTTEVSVYSDAFVAKIDASGDVITFLTYFGGKFDDWGQSILVSSDGIYIAGNTASSDLPVGESGNYSYMSYNLNQTQGDVIEDRQELFCTRLHAVAFTEPNFADSHVCQDVFLAKLSLDGDKVLFSTYFGGDDDDNVSQIKMDSFGNIYLIGTSKSQGARLGIPFFDYDLTLMSLDNVSGIPTEQQKSIIIIAKINNAYHVRVFDRDGEMIADRGGDVFVPNSNLVQDLDKAINSEMFLTNDNKLGLVQKIKSILNLPPLAIDKILEVRFPLYKNLNQFQFELNSIVNSAFFAIFNPTADILIMSSFIGGEKDDTGNALVIRENMADDTNETIVDIYLSGNSLSNNFYTKNAFKSEISENDFYLVKLELNLAKAYDPFATKNSEGVENCGKNSCDLVQISYSTLFGGENLDSIKSIDLLPNNGSLVMAGITFSTLFPISGAVTKKTIAGITQKEYRPFTREVIDEYTYFPSDGLLMKINDGTENADLNLILNVINTGEIQKNSQIDYALTIQNMSMSTEAKSVRLLLKYPYLARIEDLSDVIKTGLDATECLLELRQLYCMLGNIPGGETKRIPLSIVAKNSGNFRLDASVSSNTADSTLTNNEVSNLLKVRVQTTFAHTDIWFLLMIGLFFSIRFALCPCRQKLSGGGEC